MQRSNPNTTARHADDARPTTPRRHDRTRRADQPAYRFIPTRWHGVLDYLAGVLLIASPWLFGFANTGAGVGVGVDQAATWVPVAIGVLIIIYSLVTDYEAGALRALPMPVHLWLDAGTGLFLAASPWIFGFADVVFWPHLLLGLFEVGAAIFTHTRPLYEQRHLREPVPA